MQYLVCMYVCMYVMCVRTHTHHTCTTHAHHWASSVNLCTLYFVLCTFNCTRYIKMSYALMHTCIMYFVHFEHFEKQA